MPAKRSFPRTAARAIALALTASLLTVLAACAAGDHEPATARATVPAAGTYAGPIPGTQAYLAVVLDHDRVAGYLCDDGTIAAWFPNRPHRDGTAELRSRTRRATLALQPTGGGLRARLRLPDGTVRALTLTRQRGRAGIYRATALTRRGALEAGWIVLADGSRRGAINAFIDPLGDLARPAGTTAAPLLDTATGTVKFAVPGAGTAAAAKVTQPGVIDIDLD
jgi:hypothetical protein